MLIIIITAIIIIIKGRTKERVISNQFNPLSSSDAYSLLESERVVAMIL
jgi:hypothetical protein